MEEEKMSRKERNALRKEKEAYRQALQGSYVREMMDDMEGRPEEVSWLAALLQYLGKVSCVGSANFVFWWLNAD